MAATYQPCRGSTGPDDPCDFLPDEHADICVRHSRLAREHLNDESPSLRQPEAVEQRQLKSSEPVGDAAQSASQPSTQPEPHADVTTEPHTQEQTTATSDSRRSWLSPSTLKGAGLLVGGAAMGPPLQEIWSWAVKRFTGKPTLLDPGDGPALAPTPAPPATPTPTPLPTPAAGPTTAQPGSNRLKKSTEEARAPAPPRASLAPNVPPLTFAALPTYDSAEPLVAGRPDRPTRLVDPRRPGAFKTIGDAIRDAKPGDRILVRPGLYKEGLVVDKPLEIVGDGRADRIVVQAMEKNVVLFQATEGWIANLTLRQIGDAQFFLCQCRARTSRAGGV